MATSSENIIPVPSLSLDCWVTSTANKADYLISHFFLSEKSQTALYGNEVSSLQWIIQNTQGDLNKLTSLMRSSLSSYFSRYFKSVNVEVTTNEVTPGSNKIELRLFLSFADKDGKEFILAKLIDILDSKINSIVTINNTGASN